MRLARPIYESMPPIYAAIGGLGFLIAYLDPEGPRTVIAFSIALGMEIAALTVWLRRQDYRARSREYSSQLFEFPSDLPGSLSDLGPSAATAGRGPKKARMLVT